MTKSEIARNISEYVFILGAIDPEMIAIEAAIRNVFAHYDAEPQIYYAAFVGADGIVARVIECLEAAARTGRAAPSGRP